MLKNFLFSTVKICLLSGFFFCFPFSSVLSQNLNIDSVTINIGLHLYFSHGTITSPDTCINPVQLTGNAYVDYKAGYYVRLKPGFSTSLSNGCGRFHAYTGSKPAECPTALITGDNEFCSAPAVLSAVTSIPGSGTITSYQWQRNGVDIHGATGISYSATQTGNYTVVVGNSYGCKVISPVFLVNDCLNLNLSAFIEGYYLGSELMQPVLLNSGVSTDPLLSDTIRVELHDQFNPSTVLASTTTVLNINGYALAHFPISLNGTSAYIAIIHRNGLETWSKLPVTISSNFSYNFTGQ